MWYFAQFTGGARMMFCGPGMWNLDIGGGGSSCEEGGEEEESETPGRGPTMS